MSNKRKIESITKRQPKIIEKYEEDIEEIKENINNGEFVEGDKIYSSGNNQYDNYVYTVIENDGKLELSGGISLDDELDELMTLSGVPTERSLKREFDNAIPKRRRSQSVSKSPNSRRKTHPRSRAKSIGGKSRKTKHYKKSNKRSSKHRKN
jgi:hypothetical protein